MGTNHKDSTSAQIQALLCELKKRNEEIVQLKKRLGDIIEKKDKEILQLNDQIREMTEFAIALEHDLHIQSQEEDKIAMEESHPDFASLWIECLSHQLKEKNQKIPLLTEKIKNVTREKDRKISQMTQELYEISKAAFAVEHQLNSPSRNESVASNQSEDEEFSGPGGWLSE